MDAQSLTATEAIGSGGTKVLIFIVSYNAEATIAEVLARIPDHLFADSTLSVEVLIIGDSSTDNTLRECNSLLRGDLEIPLTVFVNPKNLGYGGNQKLGFRFAIDRGFDIVCLVHGDGQYAPEEAGLSVAALIARIDAGPKTGNLSSALPMVGSYDADSGVLTLVHYSLPEDATDYVNSLWEIQQEPYAGDVVNSYNDGPPEPGAAPLGPFYELESSSAAAELAPGESLTHVHQTFHFQGPAKELDAIARATLNVSLARIIAAFEP